MRKSLLVIALMTASSFALAQQYGGAGGGAGTPGAGAGGGGGGYQAATGGVNIQGNTAINANAENVNAVAVGQGNTAKNAVGSIKAGTNIQGNTAINANARNVNAVAVGQGNKATNDVGTIGGR